MEQVNNIKKEFDGYFACVKWQLKWTKVDNESVVTGIVTTSKERHLSTDTNAEKYFLSQTQAQKVINNKIDKTMSFIKYDNINRRDYKKILKQNSYIKGFNFKDMEVIK